MLASPSRSHDPRCAVRADTARSAAPAAQPGTDTHHPGRRPRTSHRSPASTRRFIVARHRSRSHLHCRDISRKQASDAMASMGCHTSILSHQLRTAWPALASRRVGHRASGQWRQPVCRNDGQSVASTMGFTAVDGLMMGTRCGALDPGVLLYLMQQHRMDAACDRGSDLPEVGTARCLRHLLRHAHASRVLRPSSLRGDRALCLSYRSGNGVADCGLGRARWHCLFGWYR